MYIAQERDKRGTYMSARWMGAFLLVTSISLCDYGQAREAEAHGTNIAVH